MIDWSAPEKTKEAVVREAVPGCCLMGMFPAGCAVHVPHTREPARPNGRMLSGTCDSPAEAWGEAYENVKVQSYVAAHRTQEAPAEAQEDHIAHSHEMVTQPTHSAAELPERPETGLGLPADDARYLNHSESPNLKTLSDPDCDVALRDIQIGEELLEDYREFDETWKEKLEAKHG